MKTTLRFRKIMIAGWLICASTGDAAERYVNVNNPAPMAPYTNWPTAATVIQDAVDAAQPGDEVVVTNGIYEMGGRAVHPGMTNRVAVTKPLTLRSVNGPEVTVIRGYQVPGTTNGDGAVRCVYLTNGAVLAGFTLTNGATEIYGLGGGVWCESTTATVSNCVLTGNSAYSAGGGAFRGLLDHCSLVGNSAEHGGGVSGGILNDCLLEGNTATQGGGGASSGTLNRCAIVRNTSAGDGGGVWRSTLNNCSLTGNLAGEGGGGAMDSVLNNCAIVGNRAKFGGGTAGSCSLNNCTVAGNIARSYAGGVSGGYFSFELGYLPAVVSNSIIYSNHAPTSANYWYSEIEITYSCTIPLPASGLGNIAADPLFVSASHISSNSPCRGAGNSAYASGTDIDGQPWANPPSIGCDEYHPNLTGPLTNAILASHTNVARGSQVSFVAQMGGNVSHSTWDFGDGTIISNRPYATHAWLSAGDYPVVLRAYNQDHPNGVTATVMVHVETLPPTVALQADFTNVAPGFDVSFTGHISENATASRWEFGDGTVVSNQLSVTHHWAAPGEYPVVLRAYNHTYTSGVTASVVVQVAESIHYVSENSANPVTPHLSWATAARNIQDAVDVALPGGLVIVTNGVYSTGGREVYPGLTNRVAITKPITLRSVNGPQVTLIRGYQVPGITNGMGAVRCVYLTNRAVLAGFTLTNGATLANDMRNMGGGGVLCESWDALVENCVLTGNAATYGGGAYLGTLSNCVLTANSAHYGGGGAWGARLNDCIVENNRARHDGGGTDRCLLKRCMLSNNSALERGGGASEGTLDECTITGNSAGVGGGAFGGDLNKCVLTGNSAMFDGGGAAYGTLKNCLITANSAARGGGSFRAGLNNCTVTLNTAIEEGGGTYFLRETSGSPPVFFPPPEVPPSTVNNCILFDNTAPVGANYHASGSNAFLIKYSCVMPMPTNGIGNLTNAPLFVNAAAGNFRLQPTSPCINAGQNTNAPAVTDLDGNPRVVGGTVDMGAYEYQPIIRYVDVNGANPAPPYTNWATAANVIQDAVDVALAWDELVVTNGVYEMGGRAVHPGTTNRVAVTKPLTLRSVNGPEFTVILGEQVPGTANGEGAVRCVYLTNAATLAGFTLINGAAGSGGGVWCESSSAIVSNCVITGNSAVWSGGGAYSGTLHDCQLSFNTADAGGGASGAILNRCVLTDNSAVKDGGGALGSILNRCIIARNVAGRGGGVRYSELNDCFVFENSAVEGGGAAKAALANCLVIGNSAQSIGGGAAGCRLFNSTIVSNTASSAGGGVYSTTYEWQTNSAPPSCMGFDAIGCLGPLCYLEPPDCLGLDGVSYVTNCIVYYNSAPVDANHSGLGWGITAGGSYFAGGNLDYSCTTPLPTSGVGNITNAPLFVDAAAGNFRLQTNSPCINAGRNVDAPAGADLDGHPRIVGGTVDIGAYEFQTPQSTLSYVWLQQYGLPTDGSADFDDIDGDDHNTWQEWRAWTDPTKATSALRLLSPLVSTNSLLIRWQSVSGRRYRLERNRDFGQGTFETIASNIVGQSGVTIYADTNAPITGSLFYRVSVGE